MLEIIGKTNIDFLGARRVAFGLSGALVLTGLSQHRLYWWYFRAGEV